MLATGLLLTVVTTILYGSGVLPPPFVFHHGDDLSTQQMQERMTAFMALAPIPLNLVTADQVPEAIKSMNLSAGAKQSLMADLAKNDQESSAHAPIADQSASAPTPTAQPTPEAAAASDRLRLAWISLWDTDVEDGDAVQIESEGYMRTVVLKHEPITLAIPVPADGIVHVRGIRDGDGGGITVGLGSGTSVAVFPVMSEGQVLGLKVSR
ncbi:MAG: hypothetical protein WCD70_05975 [Alphaproteobacteria bacterium]